MYCILVIILSVFSIFSQEPTSEILFKNRITCLAQKAGSNWISSLSQTNSTQQALLIPYYFFQNNEEKALHYARNCHEWVKNMYKEKNSEKIANVHKIFSEYGIFWCLKKIGKQAQWKEAGLLSAKMYASLFCMLDPHDKKYKDNLDFLDSFFKHIPKERDVELEQLLSCMCDRVAWYKFSEEKNYNEALAYLDRAVHFCAIPEILRSRAYIFMQSVNKKKEGLSLLEKFIEQHPDKALLKDYYNVGLEFNPLNNQCIEAVAQKSYKFFKHLVSDELIKKNKKNKNIEQLQANAFFQLSLLGMNYGKDISVSEKEIFNYCQKAADKGRCDAFCYAGIYEFNRNNIPSARIYFQRAIDAIPATNGNADNVHLISAKAVCHWYLGYCDMTEKDTIPLNDVIVHWRRAIELYPEIQPIASELNNKNVIEKIKTKANLIKRCTEFSGVMPFIYLVGRLLEGLQDKDGANYLKSALDSSIEAQYNAWSHSLQKEEKIVNFLKLIDNESNDSVAKEIKEKIEKTIHANAQKQRSVYSLLELILYYYKKNDLTHGLLWIEENIQSLEHSKGQSILKLLKITSPQDWSYCYKQIKEQAEKENKGAMLLYGFLLCEYHSDEKEPDSTTTDNLLNGIMFIEKFIGNNKEKRLLFCNYLCTKYMQLGSAFEQVYKFEGAKLAYEKGAEYGSTTPKILLLGLQLKSSKKNEATTALDEIKKIADDQSISRLERATAFYKLGKYYSDKNIELAKMYYEKAKPVFPDVAEELLKLEQKQQNRRQLQDQKNNPIQIAIGEANTHFNVMEGLMNKKRFDTAIHAALKGLGIVQERIFIDQKIFLRYINHIRPKLTKLFNNVLLSKQEKLRELIDKLLIQARFLGISVEMKIN